MDPLSSASGFRTSDIDEFEHRLTTVFGATGFQLQDSAALQFRNNVVDLEDITLSFWTFGTSIRIDFAENTAAALGLPIRGHGVTTSGKQATSVGVGTPALLSAGRSAALQYDAELEKLVMEIKPEALKRKLSALLGAPISREIEFDLTRFASEDMLAGLLGLVDILVRQFDDRPCLIAPLALRQVEHAIITQILLTACHQFSNQLHRMPLETSSDHVKRVEEFIEAHWDRPITVEELTEVTGVSARTLFRTFEKHKGYSPMIFAKKLRLERARALLNQPNNAASVTGVALACGFSNLGRFAHEYCKMFGELPSETLRQAYQGGNPSA